MFGSDPHWFYDDPAGVPDEGGVPVRLPEALLESAFTRRLLEALTEASLELGEQLGGVRIEVRLSGDDPRLVVVQEESAPAADEAASARITLRLPESLKAHIEEAAAREGASVNTWIVHALMRGLASRHHRAGGRRLTGFGES